MKQKEKSRYDGKLPLNARIFVDYTKKEPSVSFEYPVNNKKEIINSIRNTVYFPWFAICLILFGISASFLFSSFYQSENNSNYLINCSVTSWEYNLTSVINGTIFNIYSNNTSKSLSGFNLSCIDFNGLPFNKSFRYLSYDHSFYEKSLETYYIWDSLKESTLAFPFMFLIFFFYLGVFLFPYIIYKLEWKWFYRATPMMNHVFSLSKAKRVEFIPSDATNCICEIPWFSNVFLDYKASGDFGNNLQRVEVREHPFSTISRRKKGKNGKMKITKTKKNIYEFYARFYFSQPPKNGKLVVEYK